MSHIFEQNLMGHNNQKKTDRAHAWKTVELFRHAHDIAIKNFIAIELFEGKVGKVSSASNIFNYGFHWYFRYKLSLMLMAIIYHRFTLTVQWPTMYTYLWDNETYQRGQHGQRKQSTIKEWIQPSFSYSILLLKQISKCCFVFIGN